MVIDYNLAELTKIRNFLNKKFSVLIREVYKYKKDKKILSNSYKRGYEAACLCAKQNIWLIPGFESKEMNDKMVTYQKSEISFWSDIEKFFISEARYYKTTYNEDQNEDWHKGFIAAYVKIHRSIQDYRKEFNKWLKKH